jgi:Lrp/AsnC family transcriptional regulator for asnA, asnC and gidA
MLGMDELDFIITDVLEENPRASYREMAEKSGLSINSVHKRVQYLLDVGNIVGFYAILGPAVEKYVIATALGKTRTNDLEATVEEIGKDERTSQVIVATNDYIYPQWYMRDISELDDFMAFARNVAQMESPEVVFRTPQPPPGHGPVKLSGLDYRIINSLRHDARKPAKQVAEELAVSSKTVHKHLERMRQEGSVILLTQYRANATPDIFSLIHMKISRSADRRELSAYLTDTYKPHLLGVQMIESEPYLFVSNLWTKTLKELKDLRTSIEREEAIESVEVNVFSDFQRFDTWRDDLVVQRAAQAARRSR